MHARPYMTTSRGRESRPLRSGFKFNIKFFLLPCAQKLFIAQVAATFGGSSLVPNVKETNGQS